MAIWHAVAKLSLVTLAVGKGSLNALAVRFAVAKLSLVKATPLAGGVETLPNGPRYEGEFRDGKMNGHGVMTLANGTRYKEEFLDGTRKTHGVGVAANGGTRRHDAMAPHEIPLRNEAGVLLIPATVNNTLPLEFVLDSGAADVSIPADVVTTLIRSKSLTESDFMG
jgi:hypothetical protein